MANTHEAIVLHHSVSPSSQTVDEAVRSINESHKKRGFPKSSMGYYVGYHYVIDAYGSIMQTRLDTDTGAHCAEGGMNFKSLGIALIGNFEKESPTTKQLVALEDLIKLKVKDYGITEIYYHGQFKDTQCCGKNFINKIPMIKKNVFKNLAEWEEKAIEWGKSSMVIKYPETAPFDIHKTAWINEVFRKGTTPPELDVHLFTSKCSPDKRELNIALNAVVEFFAPYVNMKFTQIDKIEELKVNGLSVNSTKTKIKGFTPKKGLNVIITTDKELTDLRGKDVNGTAYDRMNTCVLECSLLEEPDSRGRGGLNGFTYTLRHEIMHLLAEILEESNMAGDRTHKFDYEHTLANYVAILMWTRLHNEDFKKLHNLI